MNSRSFGLVIIGICVRERHTDVFFHGDLFSLVTLYHVTQVDRIKLPVAIKSNSGRWLLLLSVSL